VIAPEWGFFALLNDLSNALQQFVTVIQVLPGHILISTPFFLSALRMCGLLFASATFRTSFGRLKPVEPKTFLFCHGKDKIIITLDTGNSLFSHNIFSNLNLAHNHYFESGSHPFPLPGRAKIHSPYHLILARISFCSCHFWAFRERVAMGRASRRFKPIRSPVSSQ